MSIWNQNVVFGTTAREKHPLPDDAEQADRKAIEALVERYMDRRYPAFAPEIVHTPDKDYYLPALKVLVRNEVGLFSPLRGSQWVDGELGGPVSPRGRP
jgi:hypothetical protein